MASGVPEVGVTQFVSCSSTSSQFTNAVNTGFVRVFADVDIVVEFGDSPTAILGTSIPIAAKIPEYFAIEPGDKVAVRTQT